MRPTNASQWPADGLLRLMRWTPRCTVLGPGTRAVVWVQGCPFRCQGCVVPESLPFAGATEMSPEALAHELLALDDIEGLTFSGGEPFAQALLLAQFIDVLRADRPEWSFLSYSGFTIEHLATRGTPGQHSLLQRLDVLIDGPYVQSRHTDLIWRGSDNQRVLFLTSRYRDWASKLGQRGTQLEFEIGPDGFAWMGIPPLGFRDALRKSLVPLGFSLGESRSEL